MRIASFRRARTLGEESLGHEERLQPGRRLVERCLQRPLPRRVAAGAAEVAAGVGDVPREDLPQPGREVAALELVPVAVRFQERLLDHVRRVELEPQPVPQPRAGEQEQVVAVLFQRSFIIVRLEWHGVSP